MPIGVDGVYGVAKLGGGGRGFSPLRVGGRGVNFLRPFLMETLERPFPVVRVLQNEGLGLKGAAVA